MISLISPCTTLRQAARETSFASTGVHTSCADWQVITMLGRAVPQARRTTCPSPKFRPSRQVIDLSALIRRRSRLNGHSPAPPASPPEPAKVAQQRSTVLGRVVQGVGRLEAGSRHRVTQHRPAVAAPPLPRVLGQTLRSPRGGTPARKPPDQGSRRTNGSGQSSLGRASNPR